MVLMDNGLPAAVRRWATAALEPLDLGPAHRGEAIDVGMVVDEVAAEQAQGGIGHHDAGGAKREPDLFQVALGGGGQLRRSLGDGGPLAAQATKSTGPATQAWLR